MRQPRSSLLKILLSSLILMLMVGDVAAQRGMGGGFRNNFYSNQQFSRQNQSYNYQAQRQQQALQARQQRDYAVQKQAAMRQQRQVMEQRRQDMQRVMQQRKEQAAVQRKMIVDRQQQAQGSKNALLHQQTAAQFVLKEQRQLKGRQERLARLKQESKQKQKVETQKLISMSSKNFHSRIGNQGLSVFDVNRNLIAYQLRKLKSGVINAPKNSFDKNSILKCWDNTCKSNLTDETKKYHLGTAISARPPFPSGSVGAAKAWTKKGTLKYHKLPIAGKVRFIPPKNWIPTNDLPRGPNGGILDKFDNEWLSGGSKTDGQEFEWDVQLSRKGKRQLGHFSKSGNHINVSLDGKITH